MHATIIIPCRPHDMTTLAWALEGYAGQRLSPDHAFDIRVGIDGATDGASPPLPRSLDVSIHGFTPMGAGAIRNALVALTGPHTDLLIFTNADARPDADMVEHHLRTMPTLPPQSLVLGSAPWERIDPTVIDSLIDATPMIFSYCHMKPHAWYPFRVAYTINLSVRRSEFLASGGFYETLRPYYYEDLAFACRFSGPERPSVFFEPAAQVTHRHPMTFDQYLDREELLGMMAPAVSQVCPEAFKVVMAGRDVSAIAHDFRERLKSEARTLRLLYRQVANQMSRPAASLESPREDILNRLYHLHIPLKLLAFRVGFLRGMELVDDRHWRERKPQGLWQKVLKS